MSEEHPPLVLQWSAANGGYTDWSNSMKVGKYTITHEIDPDYDMTQTAVHFGLELTALIAKAKALVDLLEDAETNHGGLIGTKTLRAKNELRLELSGWK